MERLELGDWLVFDDMGLYSTATSIQFNGMEMPSMIYVVSEQYVDQLLMTQRIQRQAVAVSVSVTLLCICRSRLGNTTMRNDCMNAF